MKDRNDDYITRREHLKNLSDEALKERFYALGEKIVDPLLALGKQYTSKSIERSVLLRMGFSSIEAKAIVDALNEHNLLRKGAGHCVYRLAKESRCTLKDAGEKIVSKDGVDALLEVFESHE